MTFFSKPKVSVGILASLAFLLVAITIAGSIRVFYLRRRTRKAVLAANGLTGSTRQSSRSTTSRSWITVQSNNKTPYFGIRALEAGELGSVTQAQMIPRQSSLIRQKRLRFFEAATELQNQQQEQKTVRNRLDRLDDRKEFRSRRSGQKPLTSLDLTEYTHLHTLTIPDPPPFRWQKTRSALSVLSKPPANDLPVEDRHDTPQAPMPRRMFLKAAKMLKDHREEAAPTKTRDRTSRASLARLSIPLPKRLSLIKPEGSVGHAPLLLQELPTDLELDEMHPQDAENAEHDLLTQARPQTCDADVLTNPGQAHTMASLTRSTWSGTLPTLKNNGAEKWSGRTLEELYDNYANFHQGETETLDMTKMERTFAFSRPTSSANHTSLQTSTGTVSSTSQGQSLIWSDHANSEPTSPTEISNDTDYQIAKENCR